MVTVQGSFMQFWDGGESARGIMVIVIVVVMVMVVMVMVVMVVTAAAVVHGGTKSLRLTNFRKS